MDYGGDWVNHFHNFDGLLNASKSLFVITTGTGWVDIMWNSVSAREIDQVPDYNLCNKTDICLFVLVVLIFNFFMLNLFTGIVVDAFYAQANINSGFSMLTSPQIEWVHLQELLIKHKPLKTQIAKKKKL